MAPLRPTTPDFAKLYVAAQLVTLRGGRPIPGNPHHRLGPRAN